MLLLFFLYFSAGQPERVPLMRPSTSSDASNGGPSPPSPEESEFSPPEERSSESHFSLPSPPLTFTCSPSDGGTIALKEEEHGGSSIPFREEEGCGHSAMKRELPPSACSTKLNVDEAIPGSLYERQRTTPVHAQATVGRLEKEDGHVWCEPDQNSCTADRAVVNSPLSVPESTPSSFVVRSSQVSYHAPHKAELQEPQLLTASVAPFMQEGQKGREEGGPQQQEAWDKSTTASSTPGDPSNLGEEGAPLIIGTRNINLDSLRIEIRTPCTPGSSHLQHSAFFVPHERRVGIGTPPSATRTTAGIETTFSESHSTTTQNSLLRGEGTLTTTTPLGHEITLTGRRVCSSKDPLGGRLEEEGEKWEKSGACCPHFDNAKDNRHSVKFSPREGVARDRSAFPGAVPRLGGTEKDASHGENVMHKSRSSRSTTTGDPRNAFFQRTQTVAPQYDDTEAESYVFLSEGGGEGRRKLERSDNREVNPEDENEEVRSTQGFSSEERRVCNAHTTASQRMDEVLRKTALFKGIHLRWLLIFLICLVCALVLIFLFQFLHFTNENSLLNGRNSVFEKSANLLGNTEILVIDIVTFFVNVNRFNSSTLILEELCTRVSNAPMAFGIYNATTLDLLQQWSCPGFEFVKLQNQIPALKTASNAAQFVDHSFRSILAFLRPAIEAVPYVKGEPKGSLTGELESSSTASRKSDANQFLRTDIDEEERREDGSSFSSSATLDSTSNEEDGESKFVYGDRIFAVLLDKEQVGRLLLSTFDARYSGATLLDTYEAFVAREWNSSELDVFLHSLTFSTPTYSTQNGSEISNKMMKVFDENCKDLTEVWHTVIHVARNLSLYTTHHPIVEPQLEFTSSFGLLSSVTLCSVMCIQNNDSAEAFTVGESANYCSIDDPTNFWFVVRVQEFGQRYGVVITIVIGSVSVAVFSAVILIVYLSVVVPVGFIREQLFRIVGEHKNLPNWRRKFYQCSYPFWIGDISSLTSSLHVLGISFNLNKKYVPNHILRKHAQEMELICRKFRAGDLFDSLSDPNNMRIEEEVDELEDLSDFVHLNAEPGREGRGTLASIGGNGVIGSAGGGGNRGQKHSGHGMGFPSAHFLISGGARMPEQESVMWAIKEHEEAGAGPLSSFSMPGRSRGKGSHGTLLTGPRRDSRALPLRMDKDGSALDHDMERSKGERGQQRTPSRKESSCAIAEGSMGGGLGGEEDIWDGASMTAQNSRFNSQAETLTRGEIQKGKPHTSVSESFSRGGMTAPPQLTSVGNNSSQNSRWRRWSSSLLKQGGNTAAAGSGESRSSLLPGSGWCPSTAVPPSPPSQGGTTSVRGTGGGGDNAFDVAELLASPRRQGNGAGNKSTPLLSSSSMVIKQTEDATILVVKLDSIDNVYLANYEIAVRQHRRIMRYLLSRIRHWGGAVFHRSGDCLAAVWNAFDTCPNHVSRATACGMEIVGAFAVYRSLGLMVGVVVHAGMFICGIFEDAKEAFSTAFGAAARDAMLMADLVATQSTFGLIVSEPVKQATAGLYESIIVDIIKRHDDVHPIVLFELSYRRLSAPEGSANSSTVHNRQRFTIEYAKAFAHFIQHEYSDCIRLVERMRDTAPEEARPQLARIELLSYFFDAHPDEIPPFPYFRPLPSWINFEKKAWKEWLLGGQPEKTTGDALATSSPKSPVSSRPLTSWTAKATPSSASAGQGLFRFGRRRSFIWGSSGTRARTSVASASSVTSMGTGSITSTPEDFLGAQPRPSEVGLPTLVSGSTVNNGNEPHSSCLSTEQEVTIPSFSVFPPYTAMISSVPPAFPPQKGDPAPLSSHLSSFSALKVSIFRALRKHRRNREGEPEVKKGDERTNKPEGFPADEGTVTLHASLAITAPPLSSILTSKGDHTKGTFRNHAETDSTTPSNMLSLVPTASRTSMSTNGWERGDKEVGEDGNGATNAVAGGCTPPPTSPGTAISSEESGKNKKRRRRNDSFMGGLSVRVSSFSPTSPPPPPSFSSTATTTPDHKLGASFSTPKTTKTARHRAIRWPRRSSTMPEENKSPVDPPLWPPLGGPQTALSPPLPISSPVDPVQHQERNNQVQGKGRMPSMLSFFSATATHLSPTSLSGSFHHHRSMQGQPIGYSMLTIFPSSPYSPGQVGSHSSTGEESEESGSHRFSSLLALHGGRRSHPLGENEIDGGDIQGFKKDLQDNIRRHQNSTEKLSGSTTALQWTGKGRPGVREKGRTDDGQEDVPCGSGTPFLSSHKMDDSDLPLSSRPPPICTNSPLPESVSRSPHQTFAPSTQSSGRSSDGTGIRSAKVADDDERKWNDLGGLKENRGILLQRHVQTAVSRTSLDRTKVAVKTSEVPLDHSPTTSSPNRAGGGNGGGEVPFSPCFSTHPSHSTPGVSSVRKEEGYRSHTFLSYSSPSTAPSLTMGKSSHPASATTSMKPPTQRASPRSRHTDAAAGLISVSSFTNKSPASPGRGVHSPRGTSERYSTPSSAVPGSPEDRTNNGSSSLSHHSDRQRNEHHSIPSGSFRSMGRDRNGAWSLPRGGITENGSTPVRPGMGGGKSAPRGTPLSTTFPALSTGFLPPTVIPVASSSFSPAYPSHRPPTPSPSGASILYSNGKENEGKQVGKAEMMELEEEKKQRSSRSPSALFLPFSSSHDSKTAATDSLPQSFAEALPVEELPAPRHHLSRSGHLQGSGGRRTAPDYGACFPPKTPSAPRSEPSYDAHSFASPFSPDSVLLGTDESEHNTESGNEKSDTRHEKEDSKRKTIVARMEQPFPSPYPNASSSGDTTLPQYSTVEEGGMGLTGTNVTDYGAPLPPTLKGDVGSDTSGGVFLEEGKHREGAAEDAMKDARDGKGFSIQSHETRHEEEGENEQAAGVHETHVGDQAYRAPSEHSDMDPMPCNLPDYAAAAITSSIIQSVGLTLPTMNLPVAFNGRGGGTDGVAFLSPPVRGSSLQLVNADGNDENGRHGAHGDPAGRPLRQSPRGSPACSSIPSKILAKNGILYQRSDRILGSGSFGCVYLGMDVRSGKLVAIKVLPLPTEETEGKNAEAEALIMRVKDPHVVEFISYAFQDHCIIIIMECMLAGSLHNMLMSFGALPCYTARVFIRDVLRGLNKLHSMGVIHRDVKPQNVLLTPAGNCKITDFGASAELAQQAHGNTVHGTPVYLAPEAARGAPVAVSDIWSCGIMYIQLVTGSLPYPREKLQLPAEILVFQIGAGIATPVIPHDQLDELEIDFVTACLQPEKEKRPSASRLLQAPLFAV